MLTIKVPIKNVKNPPVLRFPDRCVNCGKPKNAVLPMKLNMGVQHRGRGVLMELPVPLCASCARKERGVSNVTLVPFVVVGLLTGGLAFFPALLLSPEGVSPGTAGFPFVLEGFIGLVAGVIGGTMAEFASRILFAPVYGRLLLNRPLTILGFFTDSEDVVGLSAKFGDKKMSLLLTFENNEVGREFESLNPIS